MKTYGYGKQNITEDDINAVVEVLKSPYLVSPTTWWRIYDICARIWCVLPVTKVKSNNV